MKEEREERGGRGGGGGGEDEDEEEDGDDGNLSLSLSLSKSKDILGLHGWEVGCTKEAELLAQCGFASRTLTELARTEIL